MRTLVLSLFPGIGLLDRAFEEQGFCVVRGPDVLWGGDIRTWHPPPGRFDGVIGGPPCQAFSTLANLVRAKGHEPRFGNLIPEFERCVAEAQPRWFLMENVRAAPVPVVSGYSTHSFLIGNETIAGDDELGQEQERLRRFSFGMRALVDLRKHIQLAALMLPRRTPVVTSSDGSGALCRRGREGSVVSNPAFGQRTPTMTAAHSGAKGRPRGGHLVVYQWQRMLELQGLPPDFLADAPFTAEGKRKAVANGVPLPMGRAIARAVRDAIAADPLTSGSNR